MLDAHVNHLSDASGLVVSVVMMSVYSYTYAGERGNPSKKVHTDHVRKPFYT